MPDPTADATPAKTINVTCNRSGGWPISDVAQPTYQFGETFDAPDNTDTAAAIASGYLLAVVPLKAPKSTLVNAPDPDTKT